MNMLWIKEKEISDIHRVKQKILDHTFQQEEDTKNLM